MDILTLSMAKRFAKNYTDTSIAALPKGLVYKGEVNYYSNLPATGNLGDCYTVKYKGNSGTTAWGAEFAWGPSGSTNTWIRLGEDFDGLANIGDYISNANTFVTPGAGRTNTDTTGLPYNDYVQDRWGTLFYMSENDSEVTGSQMWFCIAYTGSTHRGEVWVRAIVSGVPTDWKKLTTIDDIQDNAVLYSEAQSLTAPQKTQARANIDVYSESEVDTALNGKISKFTTVSSSATTATLTMQSDKLYLYSNPLTSLTVSSVADHSAIQFTAGTSVAVSIPASVTYAVATPSFVQGSTYYLEFSIIGSSTVCVWSVL